MSTLTIPALRKRTRVASPNASADSAEVTDRFDDDVRTLRVGSASVRLEERLLMVIAGTVAPLGLIAVLLGWWGAAHTPYVFEQVPYLISGGLLGLGLLFLGAFFYFAHWLTQLVKEQRAQSAAVLAALDRLHDRLGASTPDPAPTPAAVSSNGTHPPVAETLVATERGTMAHRRDCVVVSTKDGLRVVGPADGLAPCKLCEPF